MEGKNELEKRQILYYVAAAGPHFASLFVSSSWKRSAIKFPQKKFFFCAEVVNPLATIGSFNSENVLLLMKLQYLNFQK